MAEGGAALHSQSGGVQTSLRPRRRAWSLALTIGYVAIGIQFVLEWRLPMLGIAAFFFAKAYVYFFWARFQSPESEDTCLAEWPRALKVGGVTYMLGALCVFIAPLAGEHWAWLVLATALLWLGIVYYFGPRLSVPSRWLWQNLPARWFP